MKVARKTPQPPSKGTAKVIPLRAAPAPAGPVYGKAQAVNLVYHLGKTNICPHCYGSAWNVGRVTAECAGCELPLAIVRQAPCKEV